MYACSCIDCPLSCPIGDAPAEENDGFTIGELNGVSVVIASIVGVYLSAACSFLFYKTVIQSTPISNQINGSIFPIWLGGTDVLDIYFKKFFSWWGTCKLMKLFLHINFTQIYLFYSLR